MEKCANCGEKIGNLETPHLFNQRVVCEACDIKLRTKHLKTEIVKIPRPASSPNRFCEKCGTGMVLDQTGQRLNGRFLCFRCLDEMQRVRQEIDNAYAASRSIPQPVINVIVRERKSSGVAAILSLIIPGLGQIYQGRSIEGVCWFALTIVGYFFLILPGLLLHILCVLSALSYAQPE